MHFLEENNGQYLAWTKILRLNQVEGMICHMEVAIIYLIF